MKKYTCISCNEHYVSIVTQSLVGNRCDDPLGEEFYLNLDSDLHSIGDSVLKALSKSRDLSISDEDLEELDRLDFQDADKDREWVHERYPEWKLFDNELQDKRSMESSKRILSTYNLKNLAAISKNMQLVFVEMECGEICFKPNDHSATYGWEYISEQVNVTIPSYSSVEVVGAAAKYAIGNCRGKGADLIRGILFPEGQPETFDDYLKELGL